MSSGELGSSYNYYTNNHDIIMSYIPYTKKDIPLCDLQKSIPTEFQFHLHNRRWALAGFPAKLMT
jgi:hypothetical protein